MVTVNNEVRKLSHFEQAPSPLHQKMVLGGVFFGGVLTKFSKFFGSVLHRISKQQQQQQAGRLPTTTLVEEVVLTEKDEGDGKKTDDDNKWEKWESRSSTVVATTRGDDDAGAAATMTPTTPTPSNGDIDDIPWGDLPECCVERILLGAGFQSALSATAVCHGWRRVASSQNFWRKMFVVHFGRKETATESVRMRMRMRMRMRRRRVNDDVVDAAAAAITGQSTTQSPSPHAPSPHTPAAAAAAAAAACDWRGAFKDAVCTEWRWMGGRCG